MSSNQNLGKVIEKACQFNSKPGKGVIRCENKRQRTAARLKIFSLWVVMLSFVIVLHCFLINIFYESYKPGYQTNLDKNELSVKISSPPPSVINPVLSEPEKNPDKNDTLPKKITSQEVKVTKIQTKSNSELEKIGWSQLKKLKQGKFPSLIISYKNPQIYIKEMYSLGAKTIFYNSANNEYYEIDVLRQEATPFTIDQFHFFSSLKRVVNDPIWYSRLKNLMYMINGNKKSSMEILLLIPARLEARWIGHMLNKFNEIQFSVAQIQTVEALYNDGKLYLREIYLKNGEKKQIFDKIGV
jgi:hypothetical protein